MSNSKIINTTLRDLDKSIPYMLAAEGGFQALGILGAPAMGKTMYFQTRFVEHIANHYGVQTDDVGVIVEKVGQAEDSAAVNGLTIPSKLADGTYATIKTKPSLLVRIEATGKQYGVVILDELAQAGTDVMGSVGDTLNRSEHKVGDWELPQGWVVVFTGNRVEDKAGSKRLPTHLITGRALLANLLPDLQGWVQWASDKVNPVIIGFVESGMPHSEFADSVPSFYGPYFTPRSAVAAGRHLDAFMASPEFDGETIPSHIQSLLAMNIGEDSATQIAVYIRTANEVPMGSEIIADPMNAMVPDNTGFQLLAANRAMNVVDSKTDADSAIMYITRLRPELQVSLGVKLIRRFAHKGWSTGSDVMNAFMVKYADFLPLASGDNQ